MKKKSQPLMQEGPGPFGTIYTPPEKRAKVAKGEVYAGKVSEVLPGHSRSVPLDQFNLALFNVGGKFYAIKEACPHAEYPLTRGKMVGETVSCASHNWKFNLRTGECLRGEEGLTIRTFPVEIRGDEVWIKL
ncbi:MAG: Rieske (2Fe-2S) protein [Deltaproteobacteria bacterium]|nr:Rieske (2Fe-2S) protein [Deltaproteobacteria bacterium]